MKVTYIMAKKFYKIDICGQGYRFWHNLCSHEYSLSQNHHEYADSGINYGKKFYNIDICGQGYRFFGIIYAAACQNHQKYSESDLNYGKKVL
jgi:hypothetical protein